MSRKIVVPGELVTADRKRVGKHVFLREGKIFSDVLGVVNESDVSVSVVPVNGRYEPELGDIVVGVIVGEKVSGYVLNVNSFYLSFVSKKSVRDFLKHGMVVSAKVLRINELKEIEVGMVRVLFGGEVFVVSPVKVPRIIGKDASMLDVLKKGTGSNIVVGKNGLVWVKGGNVGLLEKAIGLIQKEAHLDNLTNRVSDFLNKSVSLSV